ncbi:hypothetical protein ACQP1G_24615 [Nocardia sp. CA-107356]|uniref:hypothetical protein n=1 Tax=Nocardia sp. CA-107356 TaxID=3239972 RepID=UPI003D8DBA08
MSLRNILHPVTMVAAAIAAGAAAGTTDTAKQVVADAYRSVKELIARRFRSVDVGVVEQQPQSPARRAVLAEELSHADAGADEELAAAARQLLLMVYQHAPEVTDAVGVQVRRVSATELEISACTSR